MINFSDAMNQIDKSRDYNEYNEMNSSAYFKEMMNNADDEINKMMSSPLISNYKKYKSSNKIYSNMLKRNKEFIINRLLLIDESIKQKKKQEGKNQKKKKFKVNPIFERLSRIKLNFSNVKKSESNEEKNENQKLLLTSGNIPFFPKINKNYRGIERKNDFFNSFTRKTNMDGIYFKDRFENNRYFSKTHDKNLSNNEINHKMSSKNLLKSMYNNCLRGIEYLEYKSQEKRELKFSSKLKIEKLKPLENRLYNNDTEMNEYLIENINIFNDNDKKKNVNIAKQLEDIRLKRDPLLKLSEEFAFKNRKPLLTLFNCKNDEEGKNANKKGPLAVLKIKDAMIMKNLEKDNRNKNLLIKRLEEDQVKYKKGGYFFTTSEDEEELPKVNTKRNNNDTNKIKDIENSITFTESNIIKSSMNGSMKNILLK